MQEEKPLVSVIMPVYNCERFLAESIESVRAQSYSNWEFIIVDDGSKDESVSIIQSYMKKEERIRFYQNESKEHGPGIARNCGMEHIRGKYTYFMDADDWIEKDLLQDTVEAAEKTGADLVPFGFVIESKGRTIKKALTPCGNYEDKEFKNVANEILRGTWSECHELIRSNVMQNIRHNRYKTGEDICFQMDVLCKVKKVCGINKEYYHYRIVSDSVWHTDQWDDTFMESNIMVWEKERKFLVNCGLKEDSQIMKNAAMERYTGGIYRLCEKCPLSFMEKYKRIQYASEKMQMKRYKKRFDCSKYSGMRKIGKLLIKYNLEAVMLLLGTVYVKRV